MSLREHCPECHVTFDPRSVGDVLYHGLGHDDVYRTAASELYFIGDSTAVTAKRAMRVGAVRGIVLAEAEEV